MKKRSILILSATIITVAISAFGLSKHNSKTSNPISSDANSSSLQLSDFGINGGINIDVRTGKKIEFIADKTKNSITENIFYMVQRGTSRNNMIPKTGRAISEIQLKKAKRLSDVIENYPTNWIEDYNSVKIVATIDGNEVEAIGKNDQLTKEQKEIFQNATNILINVHYQKKNHENLTQNRQMNVALIVTPETEAQYKNGYDEMISYLKENSINEIEEKNFRYLPQPTISFIVEKDGSISTVELTETSRDNDIDKLLVKLVKNMPKWKPAVNSEGINVKQEFVLMIGQNGC